MAKRKKRPSLENYLSTGKVLWEEEAQKESSLEKPRDFPSEDGVFSQKKDLSEKETLFLSMMEEEDRVVWESRFRQFKVSFFPLQVMDERRAFEEGKRGELFKLRRRNSSLEKIWEGKEIAFPLLALLETKDKALSVWCNHVTSS